jgi:peptide/nickel transport system permease protein
MTGALPSAAPSPGAHAESVVRAQFRRTLRTWPIRIALATLSALVLLAVFAPWLGTVDPTALSPGERLRGLSANHWFGTDALGRDVYSRAVYGARISLLVGLGATTAAVTIGLLLGVVAGYFRLADAIIMRFMDGLMAIPGILLAIALVSLTGASLFTVLVAISIPDIPRVVRLVRAVILSVRGEPYVEATSTLGTRFHVMIWRHMMPSTVAPLIVQGTYIFASAILTEAVLSFLGAGIPPAIPSWGNIMAEGRTYFQLLPGLILFPGLLVSLTVLSINLLGDGMRDVLDPRMSKRL